ncbi:NAD-dependent deacylase [bacterium]|nr:NAD-dependent deacylase [bacterium]
MFDLKLIEKLRTAKRIVAFTGAGISAESGVPTFRDAQSGMWAQFNPEELATPQAFRRNPSLVWEWYAMRREMIATVQPNPGHYALTEIERRAEIFTLITQNVDGLHRLAGSDHILEIHGNIKRTKCFEEDIVVELWKDTGEVPPRCPRCGGLLRPDVVWFGEMLPMKEMNEAMDASRQCDVFFSIGTSGIVYPAAALPLEALRSGAIVIEINPDETPLSPKATYFLQGKSGEILPALVKAVWGS